MVEVQHTITVRIPIEIDGKKTTRQVQINCPPFLSDDALDVLLMSYRTEHPDHKVISKSWRSNDLQPK